MDIEAAAVTAVKSVFKSCSHLSASDSAILTDAAGVAEIQGLPRMQCALKDNGSPVTSK